MQKYLWIAIGGSLGSLARYSLASTIGSRLGSRFPYGTLVVNLTACLMIGFSLALLERRAELSPGWRFLMPIGFIGAYSTFSTFEWETFSSLQTGAFLTAALYVALSIFLGLIAVWCGFLIARAVS